MTILEAAWLILLGVVLGMCLGAWLALGTTLRVIKKLIDEGRLIAGPKR